MEISGRKKLKKLLIVIISITSVMVLGTKTSVVDADIIQSSATQNLTTTEDWLPDQQLKDILTRQLGTEVTQQNIQTITSCSEVNKLDHFYSVN